MNNCTRVSPELKRAAIIAVMSILTGLQSAPAQTTFHGNAAHTGLYASAGPARLKGIKWQFKTGGPVLSSPALSDRTLFIGSSDTFLYAIDEAIGREKWKYQTKGPVACSPAVSDGVVYFGSSDGDFYAVSADSGKLEWQFATGGERRFQAGHLHGYDTKNQTIPDSWDFFLSSPTVFDGLVYFGSGDGSVYALDRNTGALKWKFTTGDVVHASPAIANGILYVGSWDSFLYALDARTGRQRWKFKTGEDPDAHNQVGFQSSPAVSDGVVYVGCRDAHIYAVDAATGVKKWDYSTKGSWVNTTPAVAGRSVYAGTSDTQFLLALDAATGKPRFTVTLKGFVFASPALAGDSLYAGDMSGRLYAIDTKSGVILWQFQTDSSKKDALKLLGPDGALDGKAVFPSLFHDYQDMIISITNLFSLGAIVSSPIVEGGAVYFGSTDGYVYALE